jgi:hypothetical protein
MENVQRQKITSGSPIPTSEPYRVELNTFIQFMVFNVFRHSLTQM